MKLASQDIPGASRILEKSLKRSESADVVMRKLEGAITGTFRPHGNWTDKEFDVAYLVKALGGPRLSYVLQHAAHSPSVTTLKRHMPTPELVICVDTPTDNEIYSNITTMLGNRPPPAIRAIGQALMIDGLALEEVPRYDRKRNTVVGLCNEHSSCEKKQLDTKEDLERLREGLANNKWHYGKEGIVFALAPITDRENYWPSPVLIVCSCGTGRGPAMAALISRWIGIYNTHPNGRLLHGDVVGVFTDGESSFRGARYELCLKSPITQSRGFDTLRELRGLNIQTGENDLLGACDPKHIFKRFAQNLRSPSLQLTLGKVVIGYQDIRSALKHASVSDERINMLLNPQDKQNVPIALDLIKELHSTTIPSTPEATRIRHVKLLAELYTFFISPFTNIQLDLSAQIRRLSTYAHLIFALYRRHGTEFMKGALYGDSISIVKSIIVLVARWKTEDGEIRFYIILIGTDRIEGVFSHVQTQDHSRNCDILQLGNKSSIGAEINRILLKWPDLNRGHEKRDIKDSSTEDHINPASWSTSAELRVGSVNLKEEFFSGRADASLWLKTNLDVEFNFDAEFGDTNDILRPFGSYVGSNAANGNDNEDDERPAAPGGAGLSPLPPTALDLAETPEELVGIESEDISAPTSTHASVLPDSRYLEVDGKRYHKSSLVPKYLISPSSRKVVIRQFRAAGMTISDFAKGTRRDTVADLEGDGSASSERVLTGDIGGLLMRCTKSKVVALAVLEVLHFRQGSPTTGKVIFDIPSSDLEKKDTFVVGQVLEMVYDASETLWVWSKDYIGLGGDNDSTSSSGSLRKLTISIPGSQFAPLQAAVRTGQRAEDHTWTMAPSVLEKAMHNLWTLLDPDSDEILSNLDSLPQIATQRLPYHDGTAAAYVVDSAVSLMPKSYEPDDILPCFLCASEVKLKLMRNHVGGHLLRSIRGVDDPSLISETNEVGSQ